MKCDIYSFESFQNVERKFSRNSLLLTSKASFLKWLNTLLLLYLSSITIQLVDSARVWKCSVCKTITDDFSKGFKETAKSNYGGGNTNWEEKALGSYAKSEIRFVEIMEYVCKGGDKECFNMLEEYEELIETFWYKEFGKNNNLDLHKWMCIENIKTCCPENTFGLECKACLGGIERPCKGNGKCDGSGTRQGKGTCNCDYGYKGELCDECVDGHYEDVNNETHTVCRSCHDSCKSTCWQGGPAGCDECKDGYEIIDEICKDINECDGNPCQENEMCVNNEGSYSCNETPKDDEKNEENSDKVDEDGGENNDENTGENVEKEKNNEKTEL